MGKHTRRPFHANENRETTIGERTYIDLWGPSHVQSTGGCSYMMPCVDGYSGHIETYFLPNKEAATTLDALRHYIALTERQTRHKVKKIRTDEGMEFTNNVWKAYLNEQGIIHEFTTAYSSASNGVVERSHRTIIEHVRVCLHEARLPPSLWCEIAAAITYLMDLVPNMRHPEVTPFELWHRKKPNISHL